MKTPTTRHIAGAGLLVASAATLALAAPLAGAAASPKPDLSAVKARCHAAISERETTLTSLEATVAASTHLTAADKSTLTGQLQSAASGLSGLGSTIDADTTLRQTLSDCKRIVSDYRVYLLLAPRTHLVIATDRGLAATAAATQAEPKVDAAISDAAAAGVPAAQIADAQARNTDLKAKVADATGQLSGLADQLVALTPAQYDAGTAGPVLAGARTHLQATVADVKAARADLVAIRHDLTTR
jgi:hypothetical protein